MENNKNNIKIILKAIEAKNLLASDMNGLSDPYFKIPRQQEGVIDLPDKKNRTKRIDKNLNPVWNHPFLIELNPMKCSKLKIEVYDFDHIGKDDLLGSGYADLEWIKYSNKNVNEEWISLTTEKLNKKTKQKEKKTKGSVHIKIKVLGFPHISDDTKKPFKIKEELPQDLCKSFCIQRNGESYHPNSWIILSKKELSVGLGWDVPKKEKFEADASIVAYDQNLEPLDCAYYFNLSTLNQSLIHCGEKVSHGDKQIIQIFLDKIPDNVHYLAVILLSNEEKSLDKFNNTYIRLFTKKKLIWRFDYKNTEKCFGILLGLFQRDAYLNIWYYRVINEPFKKRYLYDTSNNIEKLIGLYGLNKKIYKLITHIEKIEKHPFPCEEIFELKNWIKIKSKLIYVGLGWNNNKNLNIPIYASLFCFDKKHNLVNLINHENIKNDNGSIILKEVKNEKLANTQDKIMIVIDFNRLNSKVSTIAITINSPEGNTLKDVSNGFIRLFDKIGPIGVNISSDFPMKTGIVFGHFRRGKEFWNFEALNEPIRTNSHDDTLNDVEMCIENNRLKID